MKKRMGIGNRRVRPVHKRAFAFAPDRCDCVTLFRPSDAPDGTIAEIMRYWFDCSAAYGDVGHCVIGAGFQFEYMGEWYFMLPQSPWQGSISWEAFKDEIEFMLRNAGATGVLYHWGNLDWELRI